jgi:hypothetical protein
VAEQHVAGQGLHACTIGVNMKIPDLDNVVESFD